MKFTNEETALMTEFGDLSINSFFRDLGGNIYQKRTYTPDVDNAFSFATNSMAEFNLYSKVVPVELTEIKYRRKV